MRARRLGLVAVLVTSCLNLAVASPPPAFGQQPLANALEAFARSTGYQLIYRSDAVAGVVTCGAGPGLTPTQTLRALLRGTQLRFDFIGTRAVAISDGTSAGNAASRAGPGRAGRCISNGSGARSRPPTGPSPGPRVSPPGDSPRRLTEVYVTAARHRQDLQRVSAAVTAIPGAGLAGQGHTEIGELFAELPGVQSTAQPGGYSIDIRGQGDDLPAGTAQGSVALELDGIYSINSEATTEELFDVDRVEILAGPQSTRYGPNADAGVVNVITRDPSMGTASGSWSMSAGNFGLFRVELAQNVPLGDHLALRIAAAAITRSSYFMPAESNAATQSVRLKALYRPADDLSVKIAYQRDHIGGRGDGVNGQGGFPLAGSKVAPYVDDSINSSPNPWAQAYRVMDGDGPAGNHDDLVQQTASVAASARLSEAIALSGLASWGSAQGTVRSCLDINGATWAAAGAVGACYVTHPFSPFEQYTTEIRLHNAHDRGIMWDVGLYHWSYHLSAWGTYDTVPGPAGATSNATTTNALFAEATVPVGRRLRLIGGGRQSFDSRSANFGPNGAVPTPTFSARSTHLDYRAGVEYDLARRAMGYVTISTGYRPGGLTYDGPLDTALRQKSEVITALELGSKSRFLEGVLQVDADAFYYIQRNYQQNDRYYGETVTVGGQPVVCDAVTVIQYAACLTPNLAFSAHAAGLEAEILYRFTPADLLAFSAAALDAQFDRRQPGPCAVVAAPAQGCYSGYDPVSGAPGPLFESMAGRVEPHSPKLSGRLTYRHTFSMSSVLQLAIGGELFHSTGYYTHPIEDAYSWQPPYWMAGLSARLTPVPGRWALDAYAHNLSNYAVKESTLPYTSIGEPRTFGAVVTIRW